MAWGTALCAHVELLRGVCRAAGSAPAHCDVAPRAAAACVGLCGCGLGPVET